MDKFRIWITFDNGQVHLDTDWCDSALSAVLCDGGPPDAHPHCVCRHARMSRARRHHTHMNASMFI